MGEQWLMAFVQEVIKNLVELIAKPVFRLLHTHAGAELPYPACPQCGDEKLRRWIPLPATVVFCIGLIVFSLAFTFGLLWIVAAVILILAGEFSLGFLGWGLVIAVVFVVSVPALVLPRAYPPRECRRCGRSWPRPATRTG